GSAAYVSDHKYWTSRDTTVLINVSSAVKLSVLLATASKASSISVLTEPNLITHASCCFNSFQ
ncbi:unnamed protein product, partial [Rotaria sp. Silwood1]